jgi:Fe-S cluster biosynthesis and repair protein YggX
MAERMVTCSKLGQQLPGLDKAPFPGALGQRILEGVSKQGWALWQERSQELIRERKLSMGSAEDRKALLSEMEDFLFGSGSAAAQVAQAPAEGGVDTVFCVKFGKRMPRMKKPPFPGALGQRVFENVSEEGWQLWKAQSVIVINHYGLSLADPEARKFLNKQLEEFFFGEGAQLPPDWTPPGGGGKGGGGKGGAAPRRK